MAQRYSIIMAGGSGQRFWPVSTPEFPKQFLNLADPERSLLELAVERAEAIAGEEGWIVQTTKSLAVATLEHLQTTSNHIDAEPARKNTLGALIWAHARLIARSGDDWKQIQVAVLTADQSITPLDGFLSTVETAFREASNGKLVTIGIAPTRPDTGFGYIECGSELSSGALDVHQFREKPDQQTAEEFLSHGNFLWNSGMFFWELGVFDSELKLAQSEVHSTMHRIAEEMKNGDEAKAQELFSTLPSLPIDIALMELSKHVAVAKAQFEWDDLGTWDSVARSLPPDQHGNVVVGAARTLDSSGCVSYSTSEQRVNLLGLTNCVVVVTPDEVLVCPREASQQVKVLSE